MYPTEDELNMFPDETHDFTYIRYYHGDKDVYWCDSKQFNIIPGSNLQTDMFWKCPKCQMIEYSGAV